MTATYEFVRDLVEQYVQEFGHTDARIDPEWIMVGFVEAGGRERFATLEAFEEACQCEYESRES